ncbi:hypothetical protein EUGRSUZ_C01578 [Eucalyptus grandis]|uniref:Pentatricopeptide repeat-containing protein n=2 Tax=Eucalyptus grandis TaxID=71139 RepID=A0A059CQJ6_EUCGR|nr:hypothetical protein EUGRSUZ_C01578 [Eucalyptus grandis]
MFTEAINGNRSEGKIMDLKEPIISKIIFLSYFFFSFLSFFLCLFFLPQPHAKTSLSTLNDFLHALSCLNHCVPRKSTLDMPIACLCRLGNLKKALHAIEMMVHSGFGFKNRNRTPRARLATFNPQSAKYALKHCQAAAQKRKSDHPQLLEFFVHMVEVKSLARRTTFPTPKSTTNN